MCSSWLLPSQSPDCHLWHNGQLGYRGKFRSVVERWSLRGKTPVFLGVQIFSKKTRILAHNLNVSTKQKRKVPRDQNNHFLFFFRFWKSVCLTLDWQNVELLLLSIAGLFTLSVSFGFHDPQLLTFKTDRLGLRGLDPAKSTSKAHKLKISACERSLLYTAVSTKVMPQKRKSVRDNADWYYG